MFSFQLIDLGKFVSFVSAIELRVSQILQLYHVLYESIYMSRI